MMMGGDLLIHRWESRAACYGAIDYDPDLCVELLSVVCLLLGCQLLLLMLCCSLLAFFYFQAGHQECNNRIKK